jgi:hypothetical protein
MRKPWPSLLRKRTLLAVMAIALVVVGVATVVHYQRVSQESIPGKSQYDFAGNKSKYIYGYSAAPVSLQQSLTNQYYTQAKSDCSTENESVSKDAQLSDVLYIHKVAGNFALVQFCGSGGDSILDNINGSWKIIGNTADYPPCSLVDQYKISKQIVAQCYSGTSENLTNVTYL